MTLTNDQIQALQALAEQAPNKDWDWSGREEEYMLWLALGMVAGLIGLWWWFR